MSKFLEDIEKHVMIKLGSDKSVERQFWYLFSYCKGLEYALENLGKLAESSMPNVGKIKEGENT